MADTPESMEDVVLRVFLAESLEHLAGIESDLLTIEAAGEAVPADVMNRVFRAAHNLKGGAATLNLTKMRDLAHKVENVLSLMRSKEMSPSSDIINLLLKSFDRLRGLVEAGRASNSEDVSEFVAALSAQVEGLNKNRASEDPLAKGESSSGAQQSTATPAAPSVDKTPAASGGGSAPAMAGAGGGAGAIDASLRVNVTLLENLMNLAGELVLGRNQLLEAISKNDMRSISASGQKVSAVTSELQETIMLTRMQPIGNIFGKFPRLVRDLSRELGKEVSLELIGKEVAVDKTILESLGDPLTHMVRNAIDHGIEKPEKRLEAGKPPAGQVCLRAFHEAGHIIIEITDDGRGMDGDKIAAAAAAKGLIDPEQVIDLSEKERVELIFLPGLSTAEKVSDVSGRGVGMDVVKANIEKIGGKTEIETERGKGSKFRIKLPLTLAIIPSLLVSVGEEYFAIPQVNIDELIRIPAEQVKRKIERIGDVDVLQLRGTLIPLIRLADFLGIQRRYSDAHSGGVKDDSRERISDRRSLTFSEHESLAGKAHAPVDDRRRGDGRRYHASSDINVAIVNTGSLKYGLIVELLHESIEIVVKPLGEHHKGLREYAGATILGDGQIALILDITGVAAVSGLKAVSDSARARELEVRKKADEFKESHSFLLMGNSAKEQIAIPLELIQRIEKIKPSQVEHLGGRKVMQYRGEALPILFIQDVLQCGELNRDAEWIVAVFRIGEREVGIVGTRPVDIVETSVAIDVVSLRQNGVIGSSILKERITLILDVFELVNQVFPEWGITRGLATRAGGDAPLVVLAEDTEFFRNQMTDVLSAMGLQVLAAPDGQAAWELLDQNSARVKLLVTDIEMPRLNGLELSRRVRSDARLKELPVIAVTSLAGEEDRTRGLEVGISDYQIKMDKARLIESVRRYLGMEPIEKAGES